MVNGCIGRGLARAVVSQRLVAHRHESPVGAADNARHSSNAQARAEKLEAVAPAGGGGGAGDGFAVVGGGDRDPRADDISDSFVVEGADIVSNLVGTGAERMDHLDWRAEIRRVVVITTTCIHFRLPRHL